ncbi:hypothetical protein TIFTF001_042633 [Ficus carica]|uniref:Uncharacterized protein n=1 Tax=Ficus carica TaxID=3494 RepID=A0AA87ZQ18_FICCA|nr:hypothetical protein TIFTF001_042633 [Ficus carica]
MRSRERERARETDLVDAGGMEGRKGGGGGGADEEGGDGEGFEGHEVGVSGVAFSEGGYAPPQLSSAGGCPRPPVGPTLGGASFCSEVLLRHLRRRLRFIHFPTHPSALLSSTLSAMLGCASNLLDVPMVLG